MSATPPLPESEFHRRVDAIVGALEGAFDDGDIDAEASGGIVTLTLADGSRVIVNRQTPNREIWVAAKSGGYHFRLDGEVWRDTRSGETLAALLSRVIVEQGGAVTPITLP
ncbi:MAG: iron donor protein CyaY [Betaproteobacteria bacterium]|nr:iron donor protein CyaY [Betaproteobacteria bacterium]